MSACPDDADPELLAGLLNHESGAELAFADMCPDGSALAVVNAIIRDRDYVVGERNRLRTLVDDRRRLRKAIEGAVLAIETVLMGDHVDTGKSAAIVLGGAVVGLKKALDPRSSTS